MLKYVSKDKNCLKFKAFKGFKAKASSKCQQDKFLTSGPKWRLVQKICLKWIRLSMQIRNFWASAQVVWAKYSNFDLLSAWTTFWRFYDLIWPPWSQSRGGRNCWLSIRHLFNGLTSHSNRHPLYVPCFIQSKNRIDVVIFSKLATVTRVTRIRPINTLYIVIFQNLYILNTYGHFTKFNISYQGTPVTTNKYFMYGHFPKIIKISYQGTPDTTNRYHVSHGHFATNNISCPVAASGFTLYLMALSKWWPSIFKLQINQRTRTRPICLSIDLTPKVTRGQWPNIPALTWVIKVWLNFGSLWGH